MGTSHQSAQASQLYRELQDQADEHKKLERRSRALTQRTYATMAELKTFCEAVGVAIVTVPKEVRGE